MQTKTSMQHLVGVRMVTAYDLDRGGVLVRKGMVGEVVGSPAMDYIEVRMDEWVPGLEEWGNCVVVTDADDEKLDSATRALREMFVPA